jgi:phosphoribosylanthranilate isomerase
MVKVKICGITQEDDLEMAVQAGADAIGFVVNVEDSPRNLPLEKARDLIEKLPNHIDSVAVTVFNQLQKIEEMYQKVRPRFIQLHGVPLGLNCREKLPPDLRLVVAVNATSPNAIEDALSHSVSVDALLVDTCSAGGFGGTGRTHDWNLSRKIRDAIYPVPMILAGGLTPENVGHATNAVRPYEVDVSTGVESRPGIKDPAKTVEFVRRAKEVRL